MFIFSKFVSVILFGQIWSRNLKCYKMTENWFRDTLLYAYYDFNVHFFSKLVSNIFWQIWFQNVMFSKLTKIGSRAHCYLLIINLMCNLSKYMLFINLWGKFHPKICCSTYLLKFSIGKRCNSGSLEETRWNEICP